MRREVNEGGRVNALKEGESGRSVYQRGIKERREGECTPWREMKVADKCIREGERKGEREGREQKL